MNATCASVEACLFEGRINLTARQDGGHDESGGLCGGGCGCGGRCVRVRPARGGLGGWTGMELDEWSVGRVAVMLSAAQWSERVEGYMARGAGAGCAVRCGAVCHVRDDTQWTVLGVFLTGDRPGHGRVERVLLGGVSE